MYIKKGAETRRRKKIKTSATSPLVNKPNKKIQGCNNNYKNCKVACTIFESSSRETLFSEAVNIEKKLRIWGAPQVSGLL